MKLIIDWIRNFFNDPQTIILTVMLVFFTSVILIMGRDLAPVLASLVIAYLLDSIINYFQKFCGLPRLLITIVIFILFLMFVLLLIFGLLPLASMQLSQLIQQLPSMIIKGHNLLLSLPDLYPEFISEHQILEVIMSLKSEFSVLGQNILSWSLAAGMGVITTAIYSVLVPLLVFFFLKDKKLLLDWVCSLLPHDHTLAQKVWQEVDKQIGNYVHGKFIEIIVVCLVTYMAFAYIGLQYSILLALMVGLSVIVPYIGCVLVTIPVALVAFCQWGWNSEFLWLMSTYLIVQSIDGNVLSPLLFSEVVDLHPIAIIVAILIFGGLWGFWGVFFAIPLATVIQSVIKAWPKQVV